MGAPPDIVAFHVGIVVRDLHAVMDRYQRMFALDHWHLRDPQPGIPLRIAYGGREGTGLAFELIEPVPGEPSQWSAFLEQRGEGVQHIGFWTPDLLGALHRDHMAGVFDDNEPAGRNLRRHFRMGSGWRPGILPSA